MDQSRLYRSVLRVSLVVMAVVFMFQTGLADERTVKVFNESTKQLGAMVGMSAHVKSTELNTLTSELTEQQNLLAQREQEIVEREIELGLRADEDPTNPNQTVTYILAAILFVQLLLILLNYWLDYMRAYDLRFESGKPL